MVRAQENEDGQRRWLAPSVALNRFQPPETPVEEAALPDRARTRYGFRAGGIGLLIGPDTVSEVLEQAPVYTIPNTPPWLSGLINLRGNLVPVFDLKLFLDLEEEQAGEKQRLLILDKGERAVGILIDGLPQSADVSRKLSLLPPVPPALREHVSRAYAKEGMIWLEFDHQGFFQSLISEIAGHA